MLESEIISEYWFLLSRFASNSRLHCRHVLKALATLAYQQQLVKLLWKCQYMFDWMKPILGLIWSKIFWHSWHTRLQYINIQYPTCTVFQNVCEMPAQTCQNWSACLVSGWGVQRTHWRTVRTLNSFDHQMTKNGNIFYDCHLQAAKKSFGIV